MFFVISRGKGSECFPDCQIYFGEFFGWFFLRAEVGLQVTDSQCMPCMGDGWGMDGFRMRFGGENFFAEMVGRLRNYL